jgi:DNA-binding HxlR family transcriptional regulator
MVSFCFQVTIRNHCRDSAVIDQEGTAGEPGHLEETASACQHISRMLARISDKWTMLVVRSLGPGPMRFNALRREIGEISQKMLASTLRDLEENGFVVRTVTPTKPPQVEYALTELGRDFLKPVRTLSNWVIAHSAQIDAARAAYRQREESPGT